MKTLLPRLLILVYSLARGFAAESGETGAPETIALARSPRTVADFDRGWRFTKGDFPSAPMPAFDDSAWRALDLPHDWSIEGPFGPEYASGNGYAPGGIGWYRKHFRLDPAATNKLVAIEFDGVYDHAEVWVNGHYVGGRPYGYSSFECDLTPHLKFGNAVNVIAVRVDHSRFADSRWYTGSGIYRHVRLVVRNRLHVAHWGIGVSTPEISATGATVRIVASMANESDSPRDVRVAASVHGPPGSAPDGGYACAGESPSVSVPPGEAADVSLDVKIPWPPRLWDVERPDLHTVRVRILSSGQTADEDVVSFGIREFHFDANRGFFLNGKNLKLKGVCLHHDASCLGAAVPVKVWERRLRTLKEIGVNAIRTSHNPPAPELLDLCDRLGFVVMDEAFDEFTPAKNKWVTGRNNGVPARFGYAEDFAEWSVRDVSDMVRRDRNHPSIILWSIGNEIDFANDPFSHPVLGGEYRPENPPAGNLVKHARPLIAAVKALDTSRPVTAALANVAMSDAVGFGELFDVVGYNYQEQRYPADHAKFPKRVIYGSENGHLFSNWTAVRDNEYISGQFLWTGIDYLGEAGRWPNRGSGAGLLDLCGFRKPLAWFRQSLWSDQPMVYLCVSSSSGGGGGPGPRGRGRGEESWNWPSNAVVSVRCHTTCDEVRLTLNGKVVGTKRSADAAQGELTWQVPFEPGVLKAIGRRGDRTVSEFELRTAGPARRIELLPDVKGLAADGRDIAHVEFRVVDANGVRVPDATNEVSFELSGPARLLGIENGDLFSPVDYQARTRKAYRGRGLAILQSGLSAGAIRLKASSRGIESASCELTCR